MLYLSQKDILSLVDYEDIITCIEKAYAIQAEDLHMMPDRMHLEDDDQTLLLMPCVTETTSCTKIITVCPNNKTLDFPIIQGVAILNDKKTGVPLAVFHGRTLTSLRTGAVGGTAIKYLSKEEDETLGIIGCGEQGYYQALFASSIFPFKKILLYDNYSYDKRLIKKFQNRIKLMGSADELVESADVIITATTSEHPLFQTHNVHDKTFIGIGSFKPNMREYPGHIFSALDHLFIDTPLAVEESGDLRIPLRLNWVRKEQIQIFPVTKHTGTILFKSVGMALFDQVVAEYLYQKALEKNVGKVLEE